MKFGKVVDGRLEIAPLFIKKDGVIIYTNSITEFAKLGYKPVQYVDAPDEMDKNSLTYHWEDDGDSCLQVWDETSLISSEEIEDMRAALTLLGISPK